jgi:hypothetical protein
MMLKFLQHCDQWAKKFNRHHYFFRNHTPYDNITSERCHGTVQEESLKQKNFLLNLERFNDHLTEWFIYHMTFKDSFTSSVYTFYRL